MKTNEVSGCFFVNHFSIASFEMKKKYMFSTFGFLSFKHLNILIAFFIRRKQANLN